MDLDAKVHGGNPLTIGQKTAPTNRGETYERSNSRVIVKPKPSSDQASGEYAKNHSHECRRIRKHHRRNHLSDPRPRQHGVEHCNDARFRATSTRYAVVRSEEEFHTIAVHICKAEHLKPKHTPRDANA
jgi:hypothetical protein